MVKGALTRNQLYTQISVSTSISKASVAEVFKTLLRIIETELKAGRPIVIPDVVKLSLFKKKATKERTVMNNLTKKMVTYAAKPERHSVKARPVKHIKDALETSKKAKK